MHAKDLADMNVRIKTHTGSRSKEGIGTDEPRGGELEEPKYSRLAVDTRLANARSKNLAKMNASVKNPTGMHAKGLGKENASTNTPTGMLAKDLVEEDASTKTLTKMLAKDHTGKHAKDLAEMNVCIKTLTGSRSKEGIDTDEHRCGGLEEPMCGRLVDNTRLVNSRSKNLAKDLAEEDGSTKTLTMMPAKDLTGMNAKDLAGGNVSSKTLTGSRSKEGIGTEASIKTPTGILGSDSKGETGGETSGDSGGSPSGDSEGETHGCPKWADTKVTSRVSKMRGGGSRPLLDNVQKKDAFFMDSLSAIQ
jgi:hypothetical protein